MNEDLYETGIRLWAEWTAMWNGRTELALDLVAPRFVVHLPPPNPTDPATVHDPASVKSWVERHRAGFDRITFHYEAGPFVDTIAGVVAGPWSAEVVVGGKTKRICGMDTLGFRDAKIHEYWTLARESDAVADWTRALAHP
jgi:hypothetical protein